MLHQQADHSCLVVHESTINEYYWALTRNTHLYICHQRNNSQISSKELTKRSHILQAFDLPTAIVLGCCSFEAYNAPYRSFGVKEVSPCETETIFIDHDFLASRIEGVLEVIVSSVHLEGLLQVKYISNVHRLLCALSSYKSVYAYLLHTSWNLLKKCEMNFPNKLYITTIYELHPVEAASIQEIMSKEQAGSVKLKMTIIVFCGTSWTRHRVLTNEYQKKGLICWKIIFKCKFKKGILNLLVPRCSWA